MKTIVSDCMSYLKTEKSLSQNTLTSYERDIRQYVAYLAKKGIKDTHDADKQTIDLYIQDLTSAGKSPSTISRCAASIRIFYRYLIRNDRVDGNPIADLEAPKVTPKSPDVLSEKELMILMNHHCDSGIKNIRDRMIICLMYKTGIKVSELISLNIGDVDFKAGCLHGKKGRNIRSAPIYKSCMDSLVEYIAHSRPYLLKESSETALFINSSGKRLTRQGVWKILKKYSKQACLGRNITPYTLRHTLAADMIKRGSDLSEVQSILGNSTKATLIKYNRVNSTDELH